MLSCVASEPGPKVMLRLSLVALAALAITGCSTQEVRVAHAVPLVSAQAPYADDDLLDIGVVVFDSGVPDGELDRAVVEELMQDGTFVQIRRAEAIFMAAKLRETLRSSGHWGSVWVTPESSTAVDLTVTAEILQSDGNVLELHARATDATGEVWLDHRYDMQTAASSFNRQRYPNLDPYQDVFNEIANDLAMIRAGAEPSDIDAIRTVAELRYAGELSPEAFGDYVEERGGAFEPVRLPATNDPMLLRTRSVRQREQLLFETLDQYFEEFVSDAADPYDGWREYSREDSIRLQEAARSAKLRTGLGALTIALSIAYGQQSDSNSLADSMISQAGVYIGGDLLRAAATRRQERRLYTQSLQELSASFDTEVKPLVVEIQGTQYRLTGTAEAQYQEWQQLLRELFISETGFGVDDIDVYSEPAADSGVPAEPQAESEAGVESGAAEATTNAGGGTAAQA